MAPFWQFGLVGIMAVALVTDLKYRKIYNWLTFPAMLVGLALSVGMGGLGGLQSSLIGFVVGALIIVPGFWLGGMGGGDLKLLAATGIWLGWPTTFSAMLYVTFIGGAISIVAAALNGQLKLLFKNTYWIMVGLLVPGGRASLDVKHSAAKPIPYGVSITVGVMLALLFPEPKDLFALFGLGR